MSRNLTVPDFAALRPATPVRRFPHWSPPELVDYYKKCLELSPSVGIRPFRMFLPNECNSALLGRLLTEKTMQNVWAAVGRRSDEWSKNQRPFYSPTQDKHRRDTPNTTMYQIVTRSIVVAAEAPIVNRKLASKKTSQLARDLRAIGERIIEAQQEGIVKSIYPSDLLPSNFWTDFLPEIGVSIEPDEGGNGWAPISMAGIAPDIYNGFFSHRLQVLEALASVVEEGKAVRPAPKAGAKLARHHAFIRQLSEGLNRVFGSRLHEHAATIATVVTGRPFSRDDVRALCKPGKKTASN